MTTDEHDVPELPARLRRAVQLVYGQSGVLSVKVWQWPGRVAVGITVGPSIVASDALRRAEEAIGPLREDGETWDFGLLDEL